MHSIIAGSIFVSAYLITYSLSLAADKAFTADSDTVALWNFSENKGDRVGDEGPLKIDLEFPQTLDTTLTWTTGKFGSALHFPDNYKLDAVNASALKFQNEITVEVWLRIDKRAQGKQMGIIQDINYVSGVGPQSGFRMDLDPSGRVNWMVEMAGKEAVLTSQTQLSPDVWTYVAATYDGDLMKVYINGTLDSQNEQKGGVLNLPAPHLYIGYFDQVHPVYFFGDINAIRLSNVARKTFSTPDASATSQ